MYCRLHVSRPGILSITLCRAETELAQIEHRQANAERNANKRGFGMSNVNEKNKRINFLNAYQNVSSAPENQKVSHFFGLLGKSVVLAVQQSSFGASSSLASC